MLVATWNVNSLRARLDFVLHWLKARRPDVVGIQELKLSDDQFPHEPLRMAGYHAVAHGQKSWNGVALLARGEKPETVQVGLPGQDAFGARLITARIGWLNMTTVYVPNGKSVSHPDFPRKLAWLDSLREHLEHFHRPDEALILGGDFNICPAPIDSWNEQALHGAIHHTEEERARFRALLDWGLADLFRERHPGLQKFSWWDYRGGAFHRKQGLRIDFLLGTRAVMPRVRSVEIDREYRKKKDGLIPSDHAPVIVELERIPGVG